jgi:hypothetical protein
MDDIEREFNALGRIPKLKRLFELKNTLEEQFMVLAEDLTTEELKELNEWLAQFGKHINRACTDPDHDHSKKGSEQSKKGRVF